MPSCSNRASSWSTWKRWTLGLSLALPLALLAPGALAADPLRGAALFARQPQADLLGCIDCHSDDPTVNNFGNIWSGRNAVSLIQRAVQSNTGGMGYFSSFFNDTDLADIAAYLGNAPRELVFASTPLGRRSAAQQVTIASSLKVPVEALSLTVEGDFAIVGSSCGAGVPRFASCAVDVVFSPSAGGPRSGTLVIDHAGTPTPVRLPLAGTGQAQLPAVARVRPERVSLPTASELQGASRRNVVLANDSEQPLRLSAVTVTPAAAGLVLAGGSCAAGLTLQRGEQCLLALRHDGTAAVKGQLRIEHDGVGGESLVALDGRVSTTPAGLVADHDQLDLGEHAVGLRSLSHTLTLSLRGPAPLSGLTLTTADPAFVVEAGSCGRAGTLQPGQRCQLSVAFVGPRAGRFSSELRVQAGDGSLLLRLPLQARAGDGPAAPVPLPPADRSTALWLDHSALDLGEQTVDATTPSRSVTLHNRGSSPLSWRHLGLTGEQAGDFIVTGNCHAEAELAPGASCRVELRLRPRALGERSASLLLWPQGAASPALVSLRGLGLARLTAALVADTAAVDFGAQPADAAGLTRRVRLRNVGRAEAAAPVLQVDGPFVLTAVDAACRAALPPAGRCDVDLRFTPNADGAARGALRVTSAGSPPLSIDLIGTRVATGAALAWAETDAGEPLASHSLTALGQQTPPLRGGWRLVNRGTADSAPLRWTISGADAGDFSVDPAGDCRAGAVLAPGASCVVNVQFRPTTAGPRRARLVPVGPAGLDGLPLQGLGWAPAAAQWQAQPSALVFQSRIGQPAAGLPLWLANTGSAGLGPDDAGLSPIAFGYRLDEASPCAGEVPALLPGERCLFELSWNGSAAGLSGGSFTLRSDAEGTQVQVPLTVSEDPAQRSNLGAGSLGWGSLLLLALALAIVGLRRRPPARRQRG